MAQTEPIQQSGRTAMIPYALMEHGQALDELCADCGQTLGKHSGDMDLFGACPNPRRAVNNKAPDFIGGQYFKPSGRINK